MSTCESPEPPFGQHSCNCTQQTPTVKLDPTTRAGASCAICGGGSHAIVDELEYIPTMPYAPPE